MFIVPALLACGPNHGDGVVREQPVQIQEDDPFFSRGEALLPEARRLDLAAGREESLARSNRIDADQKRQNASLLRQQARLSEGSMRDALFARAESMESAAVASDSRARVFSTRAKTIRGRASSVRALARTLMTGERSFALASLTLPAPPMGADAGALRTLPAIASDGTIVVARMHPVMDHHMMGRPMRAVMID